MLEERDFCQIYPPKRKLKPSNFKMCSANFCDNFLVHPDIYFHFRGLILCNASLSQFHKNNVMDLFIKSSKNLQLPFLIDGVVVPVPV